MTPKSNSPDVSSPRFFPVFIASVIFFASLHAYGWVSTRSRKSSLITTAFTADGSYTIPAGFTLLVVKCWGGGGGGGANNATESGHGGAGGYTYTGTLTVTAGEVFAVLIGMGGEPGKCTPPAAGGAGAYAGGDGGITTNGVDGAGAGVGGAGGNGVHIGGAGKYGGGGGGGMTTGQEGGGGGGATEVSRSGTPILISGGGGGGGGGSSSGADLAGDGGAGCGQPGGDSAPGLTKGGAGGAGACFGAFSISGSYKVPGNSVEAGTGVAVGGDDGGACGGARAGWGGNGKVIFELSR